MRYHKTIPIFLAFLFVVSTLGESLSQEINGKLEFNCIFHPSNSAGLGYASVTTPIKNLRLDITIKNSNNKELLSETMDLDQEGNFSIDISEELDDSGEQITEKLTAIIEVLPIIVGENGSIQLFIRNNRNNPIKKVQKDFNKSDKVVNISHNFNPSFPPTIWNDTDTGYFQISNSYVRVINYLDAINGNFQELKEEEISVHWEDNSSSNARALNTTIYLPRQTAFNADIIFHELAHVAQEVISIDENPGSLIHEPGDHLDPRSSFSEGFANYFSCAMRNYVEQNIGPDISHPKLFHRVDASYNISVTFNFETRNNSDWQQLTDEGAVAASLWDLIDAEQPPSNGSQPEPPVLFPQESYDTINNKQVSIWQAVEEFNNSLKSDESTTFDEWFRNWKDSETVSGEEVKIATGTKDMDGIFKAHKIRFFDDKAEDNDVREDAYEINISEFPERFNLFSKFVGLSDSIDYFRPSRTLFPNGSEKTIIIKVIRPINQYWHSVNPTFDTMNDGGDMELRGIFPVSSAAGTIQSQDYIKKVIKGERVLNSTVKAIDNDPDKSDPNLEDKIKVILQDPDPNDGEPWPLNVLIKVTRSELYHPLKGDNESNRNFVQYGYYKLDLKIE